MNKLTTLTAAILLVAAGLAGGYFLGRERSVAALAPAPVQAQAKKPLFYRNPMGLPDTSPVPKKDSMGMDYIAVYEGEGEQGEQATSAIRISTEKIQKLGVRTEPARLRPLDRMVRAAGRIEPDERRLYTIAPKFEGYVERLLVNVTGQTVAKGQPLFEVYSPELVSAQREYALAAEGVQSLREAGGEARNGMRQLADGSLARLRNWDIPEEQVKALAQSGDARRTLTLRSPVAGIVTEKKALQGMRFMPGEALYQIADLSSVWVIADVFEQDIGLIKSGASARVTINAYPDKVFSGTITYVYPTLTAQTRTVPVRVELANPGTLLKPGMFAQVELSVTGKGAVLTVPVSAVIDSGIRQIVLVQVGEGREGGRFEPRPVKQGVRSDDYVEVLDGLKEGEQVVVAANFLIDAESNLKAAISGFGGGGGKSSPAVGHRAEGRVEEIDAKAGTVSISHGPVASLKWPAMTMEFKLANDGLRKDLKPGAMISFEFVERGQGEWLITSAKGSGSALAASQPGH